MTRLPRKLASSGISLLTLLDADSVVPTFYLAVTELTLGLFAVCLPTISPFVRYVSSTFSSRGHRSGYPMDSDPPSHEISPVQTHSEKHGPVSTDPYTGLPTRHFGESKSGYGTRTGVQSEDDIEASPAANGINVQKDVDQSESFASSKKAPEVKEPEL